MRKPLWNPLVLMALLATAPTFAADGPLFYCMTNEDKAVQVLADGDDLIYQYGADLDAPELELRRPRSEVAIRNILKEGPILTRQFRFKNGRYTYAVEVHAVRDPFNSSHDEGSVEVYHDTTELGGPRCGAVTQRLLLIEGLPPVEFPMVN